MRETHHSSPRCAPATPVHIIQGKAEAMSRKKMRFAIGIGAVLVALAVFAISGYQEGKAYYKTIEELRAMGESAYDKRLKVAGYVEDGSIERYGKEVTFRLNQLEHTLAVRYTGRAPVPDTFKGGAEAVIEGIYHRDGVFEADKIQAKCASKYEAKYGTASATTR